MIHCGGEPAGELVRQRVVDPHQPALRPALGEDLHRRVVVDDLVPDPPPDDPPRLLVTGDESFPGDGAVGEGERPKVGLVEAAVDDDAGGRL